MVYKIIEFNCCANFNVILQFQNRQIPNKIIYYNVAPSLNGKIPGSMKGPSILYIVRHFAIRPFPLIKITETLVKYKIY